MEGQTIIAFCKDYDEAKTSNHHVLTELAKRNRVVWLNSVGTRAPNLSSSRDLGKVLKKAREFLAGPVETPEGVHVFTPLVLPYPESKLAVTLNRWILQGTVGWLCRRLGMNGDYQSWAFIPSAAHYLESDRCSVLVYYCVDEWSLFGYLAKTATDATDRTLTQRADVVFGSCQALVDQRRPLNSNTHLAPHGVDVELFRSALEEGPVPADIAQLEGPIIGFYGTLEDWIDQDLIVAVAEALPDHQVVLIGPVHAEVERLEALDNIHLLGPRPHAELPDYCRGFAVGIIPYHLTPRMKYVNPLKLREYMAAGLPVVSTSVPEVVRYQPHVTVADEPEAFVTGICEAIENEDSRSRVARSKRMDSESWEARVEDVTKVIEETMKREKNESNEHDEPPLRVAVVGAGAISQHHLDVLGELAHVEVVGVMDIDAHRAQQAAERFGVSSFTDLDAILDTGPDVVHVVTPPSTHEAIALAAIERGCHVLVEKPLTASVEASQRVIAAAEQAGVILCVDHSLLYDPIVLWAREKVARGDIGDVVSVDILRSSAYPDYTGGPMPPQYQSVGYPFRDLGVHALYLLQAFLGQLESVQGTWVSVGGDPNLVFDEWRVVARCEQGIGQVQLSWNVRPMQHQIVIQGTSGVLRLDLRSMFQTSRPSTPLPDAVERLLGGALDSLGSFGRMATNVGLVATGQLRAYQGLRNLLGAFYDHLRGNGRNPVEPAEALAAVKWTEAIAAEAEADAAERLGEEAPGAPRYLVTGASGSVGSAIVSKLLARGDRVRCFCRRPPERVREGEEVVLGNLGDSAAVSRAVEGVEVVIHAGAAMSGSWDDFRVATIDGTRNVAEACVEHGVHKLVHISSLSVVETAGAPTGAPLDELSPLEPAAECRGYYTQTKLEAERIVSQLVREQNLSAVILRPGQIFGGGVPLVTPAVARRVVGRWLVLGDGEVNLPLVHMSDVVDGVVLAADGPANSGMVVQLTGESLTQNQVLEEVAEDEPVVRIPRSLLFAAGRLSEPLFGLLGRRSPVNAHRLQSALAKRTFRSKNARHLEWRPRHGVREGVAAEAHQA